MADSSYDSAQTPVAGPAIAPALGPYPSTASLPAASSYPGAVAKLSNGYVYQSVRGAWGQTTTSLIQKIKASIAAAQNNNPIESAPWLAAPLWVTAHAYGYGQVVTNAGNDYLLTTMAGGTSGATAPTGTGPSVVSDGALTWLYIGAHKTALPAYDAPATPTFTQSFTGISTFYYAAVSGVIQPYIRLTGGVPFVDSSGCVPVASNYAISGGNLLGYGGTYGSAAYNQQFTTLDFMTDAPKLGISYSTVGMGPTNPLCININGRRLQPGTVVSGTNLTGSAAAVLLDWTGSQALGRQARRVTIKQWANSNIYAFGMDALSSVWLPTNPNRYRLAIEGDSYTAGAEQNNLNSGGIGPGQCWTEQLADLIGCDDLLVNAVAFTGFINNTGGSTFIQRLPFMAAQSPDVLMIMGNGNDATLYTSPQQQAAIVTYLQAARAAMPNTLFILFGEWPGALSGVTASTWPSPPAPNATVLVTAEANMKAAVATFGDANTVFYPLINDTQGSWVTGTGNTGGVAGNGNADLWVSTYLGHPTQQEHDRLAKRYANAFKSIINSIS